MKFTEYPYARPDMADFRKKFEDQLKSFKNSNSAKEQLEAMKELVQMRNDFETLSSIAHVKYTTDTENKQYQEEQDFFDQMGPEYEELVNQFYKTITSSKYRNDIEKVYGKQLFRIAEALSKTINPEIVDDLKRENQLTTEYVKLLASAKIMFEGEERNLSGMSPFMSSPERNTRKEAHEAVYKFMEGNIQVLDRIYDDLVKLRTKMAHKLGYKNFVEMGYNRMMRTDYDASMVAKFRENVREYIVPAAQKLYERQKERIGVEDLKYYDEPLKFTTGNAKPQGPPEWIVGHAKTMYHQLSPETGEFFDHMINNELMDLVNRKGKAGGGYCTNFPNYGSPFIFSNFNGTSHDIDVLTHEAGHAFQVYSSRNYDVPEYYFPTFEACEIHSMSMEFFAWPWMELFFGEDTGKYKFAHLSGSLLFIPYGVTVDEYQHFVYENPDATPDERRKQWREIEKKYLPHRNYDGNQYLENGGFWQRQAHIFKTPFYYIDYTLAQICAFQFFKWNRTDHKNAFSNYIKLCKAGGSRSFLELVEYAGLQSPFDGQVIQGVVEEVEKWLETVDDSKM